MAGLNKGVPQPTEIKLHQKSRILEISKIEPVGNYAVQFSFSDGHDTGIFSWDLLYDYGARQEEMWRHYLKRMEEAGASREPKKP